MALVMSLTAGIGVAPIATGIASASNQKPNSSSSSSKVLQIISLSPVESTNTRVIDGATTVAKALGLTVSVLNANGSDTTANAMFEASALKKPWAIIDEVVPTSALVTGIRAAKAAGIPVATWGGGTGPGVVAEDGDGGPFATPITEAMLKAMDYKGSILEFAYDAGGVCYARDVIMQNLAKKYPAIKVTKETVPIPGYVAAGDEDATAWLASHPVGHGPYAIWGCWDDPTVGATAALKAEHRTDVLTYGMDGDPDALEAIQQHQMTETIWENGYAEGQELVHLLSQYYATTKAGKAWSTQVVNVPGIIVNQQNVKAFVKSHTGVLG